MQKKALCSKTNYSKDAKLRTVLYFSESTFVYIWSQNDGDRLNKYISLREHILLCRRLRQTDRRTDTFQCPAVSSCVCLTLRGLHPRLPTQNNTLYHVRHLITLDTKYEKHGFLLHATFVGRAKLFLGGGGHIITTKLTNNNKSIFSTCKSRGCRV